MKTARKVIEVLTPGEMNVLMSEIWNLWQEIGSDLTSACEEGGEKLDDVCVMETLLDAQRLETKLKERESCKHNIVTAANIALTRRALEKFRQIDFKHQCRIISDQLGPFV